MRAIHTQPTGHAGGDAFVHAAVLYASQAECRAAMAGFLREGLAAGEPVLVAASGPHVEALRADMAGEAGRVTFLDMAELGRNPARIIPAAREFVDAHAGRRVRLVGEPIWPTRTVEEVREVIRSEALVNVAFADTRATVLCLYDAAGLETAVLADAERTHPLLLRDGRQRESPAYAGPTALPPGCDQPLPDPPDHAAALAFSTPGDLARVRALVADHAARAGLPTDRVDETVLAVGEVATNTLSHTDGGGRLDVWRDGGRLVCQVRDGGRITDPLAGRRRPAPDAPGRRGLWLVNQICDLVELRSHETGTTLRLHVWLDRPAPARMAADAPPQPRAGSKP